MKDISWKTVLAVFVVGAIGVYIYLYIIAPILKPNDPTKIGQIQSSNGIPISPTDTWIKTVDNGNGTSTLYYTGGGTVIAINPNK